MSDEIIVGASKKAASTIADVLVEVAKTKPELAILGGVAFLCVGGLVYAVVRLSENQTVQNR
ncbi:hypothetical protein [Alysiella filiformis]|uniref:Uncharacterized protein n=1 Tax=Alysiella filiformis DSM 16848 TaxID=1120981 RepID=A0A286EEX8_9NEIS|nr:hypothetical protein [Alysiella filiformis]QMT31837.1 hypothetical protein H3L97_02835 [Alysiella filiformis]UBQ57259.1 hypothetical protein JF568_05850 [Alysiella filiformis DSM 16848]SOD69458.1 hypothetical protein SAMN02746062_01690 [Alysiella filiformis DSM 16848]